MLTLNMTVVGRLAGNFQIRHNNGKHVLSFSLAVNERWLDKATNKKMERVHWVRCSAWGEKESLERRMQYMSKGQIIMATGLPTAQPYVNAENKAAASLDLRVDKFETVHFGNKDGNAEEAANGSASAPRERQQQQEPPQMPPPVLEDVPFEEVPNEPVF